MKPEAPASIVLGLLGRRGSGKSSVGCYLARSAHRAGVPVYYTPESYLRFGTPLELDQLVDLDEELTGALVVLDEAHNLFDRRRGMTFATYMLSNWLTQVRKRRCRVIYTAQYGAHLDLRLADQTDLHGFCVPFNAGRTISVTLVDTQG